MKLYPDQQHGKDLLINSIKQGHKRVMFSASTGYGKTVLIGNLVEGAIKKNKRIWIIVDNIELIGQTREALGEFGIDSAVIQGIHEDTDYNNQVQVVTAQTITRRWVRFDENPHWLPDLVLIDEAHIQYKAHREIMGMLPDVLMIGFSATPITKGLGKYYTDLVVPTTTAKLINQGRLSPIKGFACLTPNMKGVKTSQGDYSTSETEKKVNTTKIRGDLVRNWMRLAHGRKTIVFCVNVQHSIDVANDFASAGIVASQIDGRTNKELRNEIIREFKDSEIRVLVSVGVIIKGFNVVDVGCIVDAAPTKSLSRHTQKIGRGMRKNDVYDDCLVLDHAGNLLRNGFPEDFEPTELCNGEKGEVKDRKQPDEPLPKSCMACGCIKPIKTHTCPFCGHIPEAIANIETEEGDLKEIKKTPAEKRHTSYTREEHGAMLASFAAIAKSDGHKANLYREYFGCWPRSLDSQIRTDESDKKAKSFLKAKQIAYANRRGRKNAHV